MDIPSDFFILQQMKHDSHTGRFQVSTGLKLAVSQAPRRRFFWS